MTVLIIDDDPTIRRLAGAVLARLGGMTVLEAEDGGSGVTLARDAHPDVILLDYLMVGMDGPEALALLKGDAETAAIPVIVLTARTDAAELSAIVALGARGVLTKPFDPLTLVDDVRALLDDAQ